MHEFSLMADLMRKIESVAHQEHAARVAGVKVRLGALCHISPEHFREHFVTASHRTLADGATLEIEVATDPADPRAQDVYLESLTLES